MKKGLRYYFIVLVLVFVGSTMPSYAESSISSICDYIEQLNIKNYYTKAQAPTVVSDAGTESVSGYNGELGFSKTDFSLEQKGDLTLDFTRVYNSNGYFLKNDEEDQTNEDKILSLTFDEEISIYKRILVEKYIYVYYENGDTTKKPVLVVYDSEQDLLEKENGTNSIQVAANYAGTPYRRRLSGGEKIINVNNYSNVSYNRKDDYVYYADTLPEGTDVILCRDVNQGCIEIQQKSWGFYEYYLKPITQDYKLKNGWRFDMPTMLRRTQTRVTSNTYIDAGSFYDPETNVCLVYDFTYVLKSDNRYERVDINKETGYLYGISNVDEDLEKSEQYVMENIEIPNEEISTGWRVRFTISRYDGVKFVFDQRYDEDSPRLVRKEDKYGNRIVYDYDNDTDTYTIEDTYHREITVSCNGISVNDIPVVTYSYQTQNNTTVDPLDLLLADNLYYTDATYHLHSDETKNIRYVTRPANLIVDISNESSAHTYLFTVGSQTLAIYYHMLEKIVLPTNAEIHYQTQRMQMYHDYKNRPMEKDVVIARYEKETEDGNEINKICYAYEIPEPSETDATENHVHTITYPDRQQYQEQHTYDGDKNLIQTVCASEETGNQYYMTTDYSYAYPIEGTPLVSKKNITIKEGASSEEEQTIEHEYYYNEYNQLLAHKENGELIEFSRYGGSTNTALLCNFKKRGTNDWVGICQENNSYGDPLTITSARITDDSEITWEATNTDYIQKINIVSIPSANSTSFEEGETTEYTYDSDGFILSMLASGVQTTYAYEFGQYSTSPTANSCTITATVVNAGHLATENGTGSTTENVTITQAYDYLGRLVSETDGNGNTTTYAYDRLGRQTMVTNPDASYSTVDRDDTANTIVTTDETGRKQKLVFDAIGREKEAYVFKNDAYVKAYSVTYDSQSRPTEKLYYNEDGTVKTKYAYTYYADGQVKSERVLEGETELYKKEFSYSPYYAQDISRTTAKVYQSDNQYMTVYQNTDKDGFLVEEGIIDGTTTIKQTYTNDKLGNVLSVKDFNANAQNASANTVAYTYDYANRVIQETTAAGTVKYTYDEDTGLLIGAEDGKGTQTTYAYNQGRKISESRPINESLTAVTKIYYDKNGNVTRQEVKSSAQGEAESYDVTRSVYDSRNRLIAVISEPSEGQTEVVRYTYDAAGRLLSMATGLTSLTEEVNPAVHSVTTYAYDDLGSVVSETDALGKATTYTYDLLGNVLTKTDRNGTVFTYTYDALGRNTAMTAQNGEQTQTASYTYDYLGNVTRVVDNGQEIVYTYDVRGNLLTETVGDVVKTYAYDANGNRTSFVLAEGLGEAAVEKQNLTYAYDTIGRLMSVTNGAEVTAYTYDANHNLTAETTGTVGQTPVRSVAYTYNKANLLTGKTNTQNGTVVETYTATYFANGNKASVTENNDTTQYTYDKAGRLLTEAKASGVTSYAYTPNGNRASKTTRDANQSVTETVTYTYDKNNRMLTEQTVIGTNRTKTSYTYDHNGNMLLKNNISLSSEGTGAVYALSETSNSTAVYNYDVRNRLTKYQCGSTNASYTYGADGFRNSKTVNGVTTSFIYDGANIIETKQGETVTDYIRGVGLIKYADGTTTAYYFTDDHGSVSSLYNATGTKLADYTYDAFGNEEQVSTTDTNPFRYCGEYTDQESGLVYLRARYYDPQTGRFVSEDPAKDGLNWYVYCANNPVMFVDPWGLFGENTKLSYNQTECNPDVVRLQKQLVSLGYLDMSDGGWGYFGPKTEAAVNAYKNDNGLWNYGEYEGVVGITTWEHMGLKVDNDIELGFCEGKPGSYGRGMYMLANGMSIENGIEIGSIEMGVAKVGGDYQYGSWEISAVTADAAIGCTTEYVGAQVGARLVSGEIGAHIHIPIIEEKIYIGVTGELIGIGIYSYYNKEEGKFRVGYSNLIGCGIVFGVD